jgi:hypothetical protein
VPSSRIASLSSGEFVGTIADNPDTLVELKAFHWRLKYRVEELKLEESSF